MCKYCKFKEYGNWINKMIVNKPIKTTFKTKVSNEVCETVTKIKIDGYLSSQIFINAPDDIKLGVSTMMKTDDGDNYMDWFESIQINYCPMCGRNLRG